MEDEIDTRKKGKILWDNLKFSSYIAALTGLTTFFISDTVGNINRIPNDDNVQRGYVIPNKLEVKTVDLDGNGERETVLRYDGKSYLLRLDKDGRPEIREYEITPSKPAEVKVK